VKKKLFFIVAFIIFVSKATAQAGWFIVEKGTSYKVYQRSYLDYDNEKGKYFDYESLTISLGEVVYKWGQTDDYFIVSEISGRISFIDRKVKNTLTPVGKAGVVAYLNSPYTLADGHVINAGSALWIVDADEKLKTVTAMVYDGKSVKIALEHVDVVTNEMLKNMKTNNIAFKTVK
jgi:hypothetical protein